MPFWDKLEADWNFTGEDYKGGIGSDKSHRYMKNKRSALYIATDKNSQRVVAFKPFIESFKIDINMKSNETESVFTGRKTKAPINMGVTYTVGLVIPAVSVNEARMNKRKLELLRKFLENFDSASRALLPKRHYLFLNNLIHNGMRVSTDTFVISKDEETTYNNLIKFACGGYLTEVNYSVVTEDGFFEYDGKLFPKTYKTTITFIAFNEQRANEAQETTHLLTDGYINIVGDTAKTTAKAWPFGVEVKKKKQSKISAKNFGYNFLADEGYGYDYQYNLSKNSLIYIFPDSANTQGFLSKYNTPIALSFKPYAESLNYSRKTTKNEVFSSFNRSDFFGFPAEDASCDLTFNVLAENVNESIAMHAKFQELIKMISPINPETASGRFTGAVTAGGEEETPVIVGQDSNVVIIEKKQDNFIRILFSNLIYNESLYQDSLDPSLDTGGSLITDILKLNFNSSDFENSYGQYYTAAKPFNLSQIVYDPFVDMGFFEFNGMLWPKGYKLSLKLTENYSVDERNDVYRLRSGEEIKNSRG